MLSSIPLNPKQYPFSLVEKKEATQTDKHGNKLPICRYILSIDMNTPDEIARFPYFSSNDTRIVVTAQKHVVDQETAPNEFVWLANTRVVNRFGNVRKGANKEEQRLMLRLATDWLRAQSKNGKDKLVINDSVKIQQGL